MPVQLALLQMCEGLFSLYHSLVASEHVFCGNLVWKMGNLSLLGKLSESVSIKLREKMID